MQNMTTQNVDLPKLTSLDSLTQAAECLRVLAHPHRLRMIQMMLAGRFTVRELAQACELPTAMASEHLRLMQRCGFLSSDKEGRKVFYRVADPHIKNLMKCVEDRCGGSPHERNFLSQYLGMFRYIDQLATNVRKGEINERTNDYTRETLGA
ncbi:MAG: metalloregulator ArsR/SmtB family transcription factor [Thermodesulfobacteriota bacterium]